MKICGYIYPERNMSEEQMLNAHNLITNQRNSLSLTAYTNEALLLKEKNVKEKNTQQCNKGFDNPVFVIEETGVNCKKVSKTLSEQVTNKQTPDDLCGNYDDEFIPVSHEVGVNKQDQQKKQQISR